MTVFCHGAGMAFWHTHSTLFTERMATLTLVDCRILLAKVFNSKVSLVKGGTVLDPLTRLGLSVRMSPGSQMHFFGGSLVTTCSVRFTGCLPGRKSGMWC